MNSPKNKAVACIISGGNIDVNLLRKIIPRGMKSSGRYMRIAVRITDRPGRLAELLTAVSKAGANLQDVTHNRIFGDIGYDDVEVILDLETMNYDHQKHVTSTLADLKFRYSVQT